jgi:hypothetical protein
VGVVCCAVELLATIAAAAAALTDTMVQQRQQRQLCLTMLGLRVLAWWLAHILMQQQVWGQLWVGVSRSLQRCCACVAAACAHYLCATGPCRLVIGIISTVRCICWCGTL